jgi:putative NADH-flavin reductase
MRLAVFGATGRTGKNVVEQAIRRGFDVTAFARAGRTLPDGPAATRVVRGDALNAADVEHAIVGQEAVISTLGVPGSTKSPVVSEGTRNIVDAMTRHGVSRLVVQSVHGASESAAELSPLIRYLARGLFLRYQYLDKDRMEELVRESGLEWTIVRPARLTEGPRKGRYRAGEKIRVGVFSTISRADVAEFMLNQVGSTEYVRKTPTVSY